MNPYFLTILLSLCCVSSLRAQQERALSFDTTMHDFGAVGEKDGTVSHTFRFVNSGAEPIVVESVSTTCGCAVPYFERLPVMPGRGGEIRVAFVPDGRRGAFEKKLTVSVSGGEKHPLVIRGTVVASAPRFPVDAGRGIALSGRSSDLGQICLGSRHERTILVRNAGQKTRRFELRCKPASHLQVRYPASLAAGATDTMHLVYDLCGKTVWGTLCDTVRLFVDGKPASVVLSLSAQAVDAPLEGVPVPHVEVERRNVLVEGPSRETLRHTFQVKNLGEGTLHIRSVECRGYARLEDDSFDKSVVPHGQTAIRILLPPGVRRRAVVTLFTDDPATPVLRLMLQTRN